MSIRPEPPVDMGAGPNYQGGVGLHGDLPVDPQHNYVLGDGVSISAADDSMYSEIGQSTLLTFGEPYRAAAFVSRLEAEAPGLSLDWFRRGTGEFEVVMTYADKDSFARSARMLQLAGFRVDL